jgi:hypothetical protein
VHEVVELAQESEVGAVDQLIEAAERCNVGRGAVERLR